MGSTGQSKSQKTHNSSRSPQHAAGFNDSLMATRLPPGPWPLPVVGSMHHFVNVLPHRKLKELADVHGPLMMLQLGDIRLVVASSKETAREVLRTHDANFATRPKLLAAEIVLYDCADILFSPAGDYWRKLRQLCAAEIFSPKRVLSFRHIREEEVTSRVEEIRAAGPSTPVNLHAIFHGLTNSIVARAAFGKKRKNAPEFIEALKAGVRLAGGFHIPDLFPRWRAPLAALTGMKRSLDDIHRTLDSIIEEIIDERKAIRDEKIRNGAEAVEENLVDLLLGLQERGGLEFHLNDTILKAIILDMFAGGTGTCASTMEWAFTELMRNPKVMQKLQGEIRGAFRGKTAIAEGDLQASAELGYLRLVIKEALRLHPPAPLLVPHESVAGCEVGGYTVPAASRVVVNAWAIGRDPRYWEEPEEFRPERFEEGLIDFTGSSYEFLPFGSGRRMCPGLNFGLAGLELALVQLLYCFDWSLPAGVGEVDTAEAPGLGVRRRSPLLLCATPFVPG